MPGGLLHAFLFSFSLQYYLFYRKLTVSYKYSMGCIVTCETHWQATRSSIRYTLKSLVRHIPHRL